MISSLVWSTRPGFLLLFHRLHPGKPGEGVGEGFGSEIKNGMRTGIPFFYFFPRQSPQLPQFPPQELFPFL
jgi:hypothetical protein